MKKDDFNHNIKDESGRADDHRETEDNNDVPETDAFSEPGADRKKRHSRRKKSETLVMLNIGLLVAIALVIVFSVFKLLKWNQGQKVEIDANASSSAYDVEVLDQVFLQPDSDLAGHKDDGKETILCLGNDPFSDDTSDTGMAGMIAKKTGATVYNAAFPSSTVAIKNATFDSSYPIDMYSFFYVSQFIAKGDFSAMEQLAPTMGNDQYVKSVDTLKSIDFNNVDMIVVMYDGQDYLNGNTCYDPNNDVNPQTYAGAYDSGLKAIHKKYPFIRLVVMSLTYCLAYDSNGKMIDADNEDLGDGKLSTYLIKLIDVCEDVGVTMEDNYYGTIDADNYKEYLTDNIHLNEKARDYITDHLVKLVFSDNSAGTAGTSK